MKTDIKERLDTLGKLTKFNCIVISFFFYNMQSDNGKKWKKWDFARRLLHVPAVARVSSDFWGAGFGETQWAWKATMTMKMRLLGTVIVI